MKKILLGLLGITSLLFGVNGKTVYVQYCASCHGKSSMMQTSKILTKCKNMKNITSTQKQIMRKNMMTIMKSNNMKAPPMFMVSKRIKMIKPNQKEFVQFIENYIQNPTQIKGYCMPMAYKRFGTMPAIGKNLTKIEQITVANWIYNNFNNLHKNKKTYQNNMKCGFGKCGTKKCGNN